MMLPGGLKNQFHENGFAGPIRLFEAEEAQVLARHLLSTAEQCPIWRKSLATIDPLAYRAGSNPELIRILKELLGNDLIFWGATITIRRPGDIHPWHCDIESSTPAGGFVSAWIGLKNTQRESSLKLIPGSHRYGTPLQELTARERIPQPERTDEAILPLARSREAEATIIQTEVGDGEAVLFDGRLWHASANTSSETQRVALLLQFARADVSVRVPDYSALEWPFRFRDDVRPPVLAISGTVKRDANNVVPPPSAVINREIRPSAHRIDVNLECKEGAHFESVPCFFGRTEAVDFLECHYSVLMPGHSPHPPHAHLDEEILVVMNGAAELIVPPSLRDASPNIFPAPAGSAIYYPSYQPHTIRNASEAPVTYAMIKWKSGTTGSGTRLNSHFLKSTWLESKRDRGPASMTPLYQGATGFLAKLHAHISRLETGAGYAAHRDTHDVAIFLLRGEVAIMGKMIIAPSVVFLPAGSLHDMRACGIETAKYLVWEFHRTLEEQIFEQAPAVAGTQLPPALTA